MSRPSSSGTFQPLRHRSGTMRDRLHGYTKRTLGAGGSMNEAVSLSKYQQIPTRLMSRTVFLLVSVSHYITHSHHCDFIGGTASWRILCWMGSCTRH
jgi:hypothetical protein